MLPMELQIASNIASLEAGEWNRVSGTDSPFLRHEFLVALERHGAVGEQYGWLPRYLLAREDGRLIGAVPLYLKHNSYGEFVFDWAWADAFHRHRLPYYPKAVVSVPYTPVTGPRLLVHPDADRARVARALVELARALMEQEDLSSLHWLFTDEADTALLCAQGFMPRLGCQFHWHNQGYRAFEDFLARLNSRKRKQLRRERRHVQDAGIELQVLHGSEMSHAQWSVMHAFYRSTFEKKSGIPTLSQGFFEELGRTMGAQLVLVFAHHQGEPVAGAINFRSQDTLYGRHWGCREDFHSLHFEACYYQGIEYCIANGLRTFEPGAQGEHKISRGFLPTATWSTHWIRNEGFRSAIGDFLRREQHGMQDYMQTLAEQSPYRQVDAA